MDSVELNHPSASSHVLHQPTKVDTASLASDHLPNPQVPASEAFTASSNGSAGEEEAASRRRKRRSRWDSPLKCKSRWADDDELKPIIQLPEFDPEIRALNIRLLEISKILQSGMPLDEGAEGKRSPSPEPIYDNIGIRINTREHRAKERLNRERQEIISQIINKNPAFKPPVDYRPPKLQRKLFIPRNEFPGYSFIGLIIGPRGNTQKRMQRETGAKIVIRGKGSVKEGRHQQKRYDDPSENEDLHVLVEAETQEALEAAAGMVEKLLQPVDEVLNEHKRQQLKELAALNGTIRDEEFCRKCGEPGHRQYACPSSASSFKSDVLCKICGDGGHPSIDCPVKGTTGKKMDDEYRNFLAELGGTVPESSLKLSTTTLALGPGSNPPWANKAGLGSTPSIPSKEYDETNLYVGCLPPMLDDDGLIDLFSNFGEIVTAKVIKDHGSGLSRGYGFVKYADVQMANTAVQAMNGYRLEGKTLTVRIAGKPPPVPQPPTQAYPYAPPGSYHPSQQYATGGQHMYPYGMHYPPPPPPHVTQAPPPPGTASHNPYSSKSQQSFPPYGAPASSVPPNVYVSSVAGFPGQPPYMSYPSCYNAVPASVPGSSTDHSQSMGSMTCANDPPVSTSDHSQDLGNAPWAPNPLMLPTVGYSQNIGNVSWAPKPPVQPHAENPFAVGNSEYDKFMAEMR